MIAAGTRRAEGVSLGALRGPLGAWVALWGAAAFGVTMILDRWWQSTYGLAAGIWHPPQIAKAFSFLAVSLGAFLCWPVRLERGERGSGIGFSAAGGVLLALVAAFTLAESFANRQHSATFGRFPATRAASISMGLTALMVWILPLVPGSPLAGPIYHLRDHLLPPPFPLLLVAPAVALDWLLRSANLSALRRSAEAGLAFFVLFIAAQWPFANFLLSPRADHPFFAGGGRHWPFFMRLSEGAQNEFWPGTPFDLFHAATALALALLTSRVGLAVHHFPLCLSPIGRIPGLDTSSRGRAGAHGSIRPRSPVACRPALEGRKTRYSRKASGALS